MNVSRLETVAKSERGVAPVLQQYGPYYPADLCYGRYFRPQGPYHMAPPQPESPMVGVGSEPYPAPQYYGAPPCYQHSPQRIPYVVTSTSIVIECENCIEYLANVYTKKLAKNLAQILTDIIVVNVDRDPPLETEPPEPPTASDAPHPCTLPDMGGASPKRELYDVRDNLRLVGDLPGSAEALGPPSPARGSAGICAPQPPPIAPRRARLGKAMARKSLVGDDTALLLSTPQRPCSQQNDGDDDVLAISPPLCAPIDLSSSDERTTPLVDVKKENEGPTFALSRKADAQALKEHNTSNLSDTVPPVEITKPVKRRYSRPKLEIEMKDVQLDDVCKTNGIGEHVKLQKRRKVSGDQTDSPKPETIVKEPKRRTSQNKKSLEKKSNKRRSDTVVTEPKAKKMPLESTINNDQRVQILPIIQDNILVPEDPYCLKPKNKSAVVLDNLIKKNSVERTEIKGLANSDTILSPADLFLPSNENTLLHTPKRTLNINNNVVESNTNTNGVKPKTIAAVSQLIEKKLASKNACKLERVDSRVTHTLKSVLNGGSNKESLKNFKDEDIKSVVPSNIEKCVEISAVNSIIKIKEKCDIPKNDEAVADIETLDSNIEGYKSSVDKSKRCKITVEKQNGGEFKAKSVEKVAKLLVSKKTVLKTDDASLVIEDACSSLDATVKRRTKRRRSGARRPRRMVAPLAPPDISPRPPPRWSNALKMTSQNDSRQDMTARCWSRMSHASGDRVARGDCVLLRASPARAQPFVARVASLWENPNDELKEWSEQHRRSGREKEVYYVDFKSPYCLRLLSGEMMVSLVWYYRPEHTDRGRLPTDAPDEVFASRHRDANSVACIEDKCYVLTFNEYCRYKKRLKAMKEGITIAPSIVPALPSSEVTPAVAPNDTKLPPSVSPELVLFCRRIYDFRSKKIHEPNK
ncbi:unnamed protein product [Leptidea sinapis]|uniref:BAH domain-containing protein n=1 Tax=Leptidea sinapis TaxID=189913 RepID=A0A5E4PWI8_9NEOP|nr:unnamed protein product [Leptidea sinapis]